MPQESLGYVNLEWTCQRCGAKNKGTQKACSSCGAAMPEGQKFDLPEQQQLITDKAELEKAGKGPDIHCPYCGTRNPAGAETCTQCGGNLKAGTARQAGEVMGAYKSAPVPDVACPHCGAMNPGTALNCRQCGGSMARQAAAPAAPTTPAKAGPVPIWAVLAGVGALVLLCACVYLAFFRTTDTAGTVRAVAWERKVDILALRPVKHSDWEDNLPSNATPGTCNDKHRTTQDSPAPNATKVCGTPYTVDQGNGTGKVVQDCKYEVYDSWCEYTVNEWTVVDSIAANGNDSNPYWPELSLQYGQREGDRHESYKITFSANDKEYNYTTSDAKEFARFKIGGKWTLKVNALGGVTDVVQQ